MVYHLNIVLAVLVELIRTLNVQGTDVSRAESIWSAVERGDKERLTELLTCADPVDFKFTTQVGYEEFSALAFAAKTGKTEFVQMLIFAGADVNCMSGRTPLIWAALEGHTAIVELLAHSGAMLNAQDEDGYTALASAAGRGNIASVLALVRLGAKIDLENKDGETPLILAVKGEHAGVVEALLEAGAHRAQTTSKGLSPMRAARSRAMREFLVNYDRDTPSHIPHPIYVAPRPAVTAPLSNNLRPRAASEPARQFVPPKSGPWSPPKPAALRPRGYTAGYLYGPGTKTGAGQALPSHSLQAASDNPLTFSTHNHMARSEPLLPVPPGPGAGAGTARAGVKATSTSNPNPNPSGGASKHTVWSTTTTTSSAPEESTELDNLLTPITVILSSPSTVSGSGSTSWLATRLHAKGLLAPTLVAQCEAAVIGKLGIDSEMAYAKFPSEKLTAQFWKDAGIVLKGQQGLLTELHRDLKASYFPTMISGKEEAQPSYKYTRHQQQRQMRRGSKEGKPSADHCCTIS